VGAGLYGSSPRDHGEDRGDGGGKRSRAERAVGARVDGSARRRDVLAGDDKGGLRRGPDGGLTTAAALEKHHCRAGRAIERVVLGGMGCWGGGSERCAAVPRNFGVSTMEV
jgi:hypothetical protein